MKKIIAFLICSVLIFSSLSFAASAAEADLADQGAATDVVSEAADADVLASGASAEESAPTGWSLLSESEFQSKLSSLRNKYPHGSVWDGYYYENGSVKASTCWAYAAQMLYEVFGVKFYADGMLSYKYTDSSGIAAGDWVRIDYDSHSIFITKVTDSGVYFTDGNGTGVYNQVRWDGFYSWSEIRSRFSYRLHLPGNSLTGTGAYHTVAYHANGGSGSMSSSTVLAGDRFKLKANGFSRSGYSFAGYTVKRSYDNTWYTTDAGWQTQSAIYDNGYTYKIYPAGNTYTLGTPWIGGIGSATTFTFYAQWLPDNSTVEFLSNYSGYNYILGSGLGADYADYIYSRNSSVYTLSVDSAERLNNAASLKITGKSAGALGTDLAILTSTNRGYAEGYSQAGIAGDNKELTLHFYAKSSVNGAKMYIRWGYNSNSACQSVTLSTRWQVYSITLPKNRFLGSALHPYFDQAGTYYLNSLALGDYARTSNVVPENGGYAAPSQSVTRGGKPASMPTPARYGYTFLGWYTAAEGGTRVTADTTIQESTLRLYAHWKKDVTETPVKTVIENGHVYELYDNALGWEDASRFCASQGGHLITIGSEAENRMAYDMISDRQGYCWIGLHYLSGSKLWDWVDDTDPASYSRWYDSSYPVNDSGEHYALLYPMNLGTRTYAGTWDKCVGSSYYSSYYGYCNSFFICEYDAPIFRGDADGNGEIETPDVTLIQRHGAGMSTNIPEDILLRGDVNGDGELEITDATFIQRYVAKMDTPYPVGEWQKI